MTNRRALDEHVALYSAFATRVGELSPSAWARIEARCAALSDASFGALVARAALTAKAHELRLPAGAERSVELRAIKTTSDIIGHGFAFAIEVLAEFDAASEPRASGRGSAMPDATRTPPRDRSPRVTALIDAHQRLEAALLSRARQFPGVVTAVRAASEGVRQHDWLTPDEFFALYQYVEPEIPFTSLMPPTGPAATAPDVR